MIYATSELAYYCGLKPNEFWDMSYKEVTIYCQSRLAYINDRLKENIIVEDASTNKILNADPLLNKYPKINSLTKIFNKLFKKDDFF